MSERCGSCEALRALQAVACLSGLRMARRISACESAIKDLRVTKRAKLSNSYSHVQTIFLRPEGRPIVDERHYKMMRLLETNPEMSQRDLARELGISLGKVNYCLQALISKGWIKVSNFTNNQNKAAYMYLLTPRGIEQKAALTIRFLRLKIQEYEVLRAEIKQMRREADQTKTSRSNRRNAQRDTASEWDD